MKINEFVQTCPAKAEQRASLLTETDKGRTPFSVFMEESIVLLGDLFFDIDAMEYSIYDFKHVSLRMLISIYDLILENITCQC